MAAISIMGVDAGPPISQPAIPESSSLPTNHGTSSDAALVGEGQSPTQRRDVGDDPLGRAFEDQVLSNQDLVNIIVDHYKLGFVQVGGKKNKKERVRTMRLSPLLTLSRAFFEATSAHLWRKLPSIMLLFNLLPESVREENVSALWPLSYDHYPDEDISQIRRLY
jgi:hypothetical protein